MALLAAFGALVARRFDSTDLVIGSPIAGRRDRRLEDSVGLFTNVVPIRLDVSGRPTFRTLLRRVRQVATEAYANQELPIEALIQELGLGPAGSRPPLFQVMFALHNYPATPGSFAGLRGRDLRDTPSRLLEFYSPTATRVDLSLGIGDRADELGGVLEYNRRTVGDQNAAALADEYARLVGRGVEMPDAALEGLAP
jgi:non-ribosomal peptide synthetase component F